MFIASNTIAYDMLKNRIKNKLLLNQITFWLIAALSVILALFFEGSFKKIWFTMGSYMSACLLIPMLSGYIFPNRIKDNTFVVSSLCAAACMTLWAVIPHSGLAAQIDGFYIGLAVNILIISFSFIRGKYAKS